MDPRDQMLARTYVVLTLLALLPLGIAVQMSCVYVQKGPSLREQGRDQAQTRAQLPAMRGEIRDREGRVLATSVARYDLALDPKVDEFAAKAEWFYDQLADLTGRSDAFYRRRVRSRHSPRYVRLRRNLTRAQTKKVRGWDVPGVILTPRFARHYPHGETAAHVLGHVGANGDGLAGLELQYDDTLSGAAGWRALARDRSGTERAPVEGGIHPPQHGNSLRLTIDLVRQSILEEELRRGVRESGARWGTALAVNPETGAILAMANAPTYDANHPGRYRSSERRNRAVTDQLEPGSTFKLVTAIAALEEGVISMTDSVETGEGWARVAGRTIHDTHAHGTLSLGGVITKSSNIGAAKTAARMKPLAFYRRASTLGFGHPTGVDLPGEVSGALKKPDRWSSTTQTALGYGYEVAVTPLQLLTVYCALANGGRLVEPHVVAAQTAPNGDITWRAPDSSRRVFSEETARKLLPAFKRVVSEKGTASRAQVEGLRIAGKTGTARKVKNGRYAPGAYRASFVGFFPADDPEVALLVVMDEPEGAYYGGAVAAPVFQRIARRWTGLFPGVADRFTPETLSRSKQPVPKATQQPLGVAQARLAAAGYRASPASETASRAVTAQTPERTTPLAPGRTVALSAKAGRSGRRTMPDVTGLGARRAVFWLRELDVRPTLDGSGEIARQQPAPGEPLPDEATLRAR
jgi:cell division protein FtsI (penicillin-binding protein 3)